jgi:hypothetical protein
MGPTPRARRRRRVAPKRWSARLMRRRDFIAGFPGGMLAAKLGVGQVATRRPRLLFADTDPFTGIPLLKARYAAGFRPSDDMEGWALSWQLTGQGIFAERAISEMRKKHVTAAGKPSRSWVDYARWALAFDWLFDFRGFDRALKDRIAGELRDVLLRCYPVPTSPIPVNSRTTTTPFDISRSQHLRQLPLMAIRGAINGVNRGARKLRSV